MRRTLTALWMLSLPAAAFAQAEIAGVVKDTSGAVLPGVTIEAASPALIERVRSVASDGSGQYRIVDLRPGSYTVTLTLPGFNTIRREGIELTGTATYVVNAEMRVGSLEETITVTGQAPAVDVQTVTRQRVLGHDIIDAIPTGRMYYNLGVLLPGVSSSSTDVGGSLGDAMSSLTTHGSRAADQRVMQNGVNLSGLTASGNIAGTVPNVGAAQEVTIDTGAVSAELAMGGPRINFIPRDGGNALKGSVFAAFARENFLQDSNYTQRLKDRGLTTPTAIKKNWDVNPGFGGPVRRDRLWYYFTGRFNGAQNYAAGMFHNKNAWDPAKWTYEPDPSRPALSLAGDWEDAQIRLTWQATAKNKFAGSWDQQMYCRCPFDISATTAPEAATDRRFPTQRVLMAEWSSPATSRLLFEVVGLHRTTRWGNMHLQPSGSLTDPAALAAYPQLISVVEQSSGLMYRSAASFNNNWNANYFYRGAVSYITGTHAFKAGFNNTKGSLYDQTYTFQPISYRFNNGVPNQVTIRATPYRDSADLHADLGVFAQDKWTIGRLTTTLGIRYDQFNSGYPEQHLGPGVLVPTRDLTFDARDNLGWKDVTPRMGASYDLFGSGTTAVKISLNKYLQGQGLNALARNTSPVATLVLSTTRSWTDTNRNFVADCDLLNPLANAECGAMASQNFGRSVAGAAYDPDLLRGWNHRPSNWEFSTGVQREILPRVSVDAGYFRRWYGNFQVTDNVLAAAADYNSFALAVPSDPRLPGGGGYQITALDLNPAKVGQVSNLNTLSDRYGKQIEHWNGVDVSMNARLESGLLLSGGISTGRRATDNCEIAAKVPEALFGAQNLTSNNNNVWLPAQWCHQEEPFLTQFKAFGVYAVPRIDVQVAGTFQSIPGPLVAANFNAPSAAVASSLGRPLSGGAANITVNLVEPGAMYGERLNQLDLRMGKILRFGRIRTTVNLDVYNAFNVDAVLTQNNNFGAWQRPQSIVQARFAKISAQLDF